MRKVRTRVAAALLSAVLSVLTGAQAHATSKPSISYQCTPRQRLVVSRTPETAVVQFIDRSYELRRKPSSIGVKYISPTAALIIDGSSAVFVAQDRLQLGSCVEASRLVAHE